MVFQLKIGLFACCCHCWWSAETA